MVMCSALLRNAFFKMKLPLVDSSDLHPHLHMNNIQLPRSIQHIASGWLLELASAGC